MINLKQIKREFDRSESRTEEAIIGEEVFKKHLLDEKNELHDREMHIRQKDCHVRNQQ